MNKTTNYAAPLPSRFLCLIVCLMAFYTNWIHGADVRNYAVYKYQSYRQTNASTVARTDGDKYVFVTAITPTSPTSVSSVSVTLPNGTVIPNSRFAAAGSAIDLATSFPPLSGGSEIQSLGEFDTAYPSGSYTVSMTGATDGIRSASLNLTGNAYPNTPLVSNFLAVQSVNPANSFTLQWSPMVNSTTTDAIWVEIRSFDGQSPTTVVWRTPFPGETGALNGTATSATIPANTLQSGTTYLASIFFGNVTTLNTSSYPGALGYAGYGMRTHFDLQTTGGATAPTFTSHPQNRTINEGESVTFTASASGTAPIGYQWKKDGADLPGRTTSVLTISNASLSDSGSYTVVATNSAGQATSSTATLTVLAVPPQITVQPVGETVSTGESVVFSVNASGTAPLSYQWKKDGSGIVGAISSTHTLTNVTSGDAGTYTVTVTNFAGSVTSAGATLTVNSAPQQNQHPDVELQATPSHVAPGQVVTLTASAIDGDGSIVRVEFFDGFTRIGEATNAPYTLSTVALGQGLHQLTARATDNSGASSISGVKTVAVGGQGTVVAWGRNTFGQSTVPAGLSNVTAVAAGAGHSVALKANGAVVAWGDDSFGQATVPGGLNEVVAITAGGNHTVALRRDGTLVGWGLNSSGQITIPTGAQSDVVAVSAGAVHTIALKKNGTVVAWGSPGANKTAVPPGLSNVVAIAAGVDHNLALKIDGTIVAWGQASSGAANVPAGLSDIVAVAANRFHSMALKSDHTVVAWGSNEYGRLDIPQGLNEVTGIAAGGYHSVALKADGAVVAWGAGTGTGGSPHFGQSVAPPNLRGVMAVAAAEFHSLALVNSPRANEVLTLDGSGDYVTIPSAPELQDPNTFTIEAWLRPVDNGLNSPTFINKGDGQHGASSRSYEIQWTKDLGVIATVFLGTGGNATYATLRAPAPADQWTHMAATYDSPNRQFCLYTNGVLAACTTNNAGGNPLTGQTLRSTTLPLVFGYIPAVGSSTFITGKMDEVRIWTQVRTQAEIIGTMFARLTGSEPGLAGYWTFDDGTAVDATGHGHNGVFSGDASTVSLSNNPLHGPFLRAERNGSDVWIRWPTTARSFLLESAGSFSPTMQWMEDASAVQTIGEDLQIIAPQSGSAKFYRLKRP